MKIGCPNHPRKNLLDEIRWIGDQGFDFLDLFMEPEAVTPETIPVDAVAALLSRYGLGVVGHTAWYLPIGSPIKLLRQAAIDEVARSLPVLRDVGVRYVTIHGHWASQKLFTLDEAVGLQVESLCALVDLAATHGLEIMYEPVPDPRDSVATMQKILAAVSGLRLHVDIGHANIHGRVPAEYFGALHANLVHIHLHDNNGMEDQHLPLGCGTINWERTVSALKACYDGTITLEIFSPDRDYILISKEKLQRLWAAA